MVEKILFFMMNLLGMFALGNFFFNWWFTVHDAGLVDPLVALIVSLSYLFLSGVQLIYVGDAIFYERK